MHSTRFAGEGVHSGSHLQAMASAVIVVLLPLLASPKYLRLSFATLAPVVHSSESRRGAGIHMPNISLTLLPRQSCFKVP